MRCKRCRTPILSDPRDFPSCIMCGWEDYSYTGDHVTGHSRSALAEMDAPPARVLSVGSRRQRARRQRERASDVRA